MDDLELIRGFRKDDSTPNPVAREAARERLVAHMGSDRPVVSPATREPLAASAESRPRRAIRDRALPLVRRRHGPVSATIAIGMIAMLVVCAVVLIDRAGDDAYVAVTAPQDMPGLAGPTGAHGPADAPGARGPTGAPGPCEICVVVDSLGETGRFTGLEYTRSSGGRWMHGGPPDSSDLQARRVRLRRALAIEEAVYGPMHPAVAMTLARLGSVEHRLGDIDAARANTLRAIAISKRVFGARARYTRLARRQLASFGGSATASTR